MLKATLLEKPPIIDSKKIKSDKIKIEKNEYNICKSLFDMDNINMALDNLSLKYKMINEVDIYNIIEYILATSKGKTDEY